MPHQRHPGAGGRACGGEGAGGAGHAGCGAPPPSLTPFKPPTHSHLPPPPPPGPPPPTHTPHTLPPTHPPTHPQLLELRNPVEDRAGYVYERSSIEGYLASQRGQRAVVVAGGWVGGWVGRLGVRASAHEAGPCPPPPKPHPGRVRMLMPLLSGSSHEVTLDQLQVAEKVVQAIRRRRWVGGAGVKRAGEEGGARRAPPSALTPSPAPSPPPHTPPCFSPRWQRPGQAAQEQLEWQRQRGEVIDV